MKKPNYITEEDLEPIVDRLVQNAIAKAFGLAKPDETVLPTKLAYRELGYASPKQLYSAIESGLLTVGKEVEDRRKPASSKPQYYFNIAKCRKTLKMLPEKRPI